MKAKRSNTKISPHGGAVPILKKIKEFGIPQVIRKCLGVRKKQAKYGYEDVFIGLTLMMLCGGTRLHDVTKLKRKLNIIPGLKIPSHDTLGRVMKKLATEVKTERNISTDKIAKISYTDYNDNTSMNMMLVKATKRIGALEEGRKYTLDIDSTFIATQCRGAKRRVNENGKIDYARIGFSPMVCLIQDLPVYISMRNGNAGPRFQIYECLENCLNLLNDSKIKVGRIISDAAGYHKKTLAMIDNNGIKFNIRFPFRDNMLDFSSKLKNCKTWRETEIETANHFWQCEVADISYTMSKKYYESEEAKTYRVVALRIPTEKTKKRLSSDEELQLKKINLEKLKGLAAKKVLKEKRKTYAEGGWKEINGYLYKFYITNDHKKTSEEIIIEYNKRGNAERKFSFMKNDFAWRLPPFSNLNENAVFLIAASLANNIFKGMLSLFKKQLPELRLNVRIREFQFIFIDVPCEYIGGGMYEFFNTEIAFEKIM